MELVETKTDTTSTSLGVCMSVEMASTSAPLEGAEHDSEASAATPSRGTAIEPSPRLTPSSIGARQPPAASNDASPASVVPSVPLSLMPPTHVEVATLQVRPLEQFAVDRHCTQIPVAVLQ